MKGIRFQLEIEEITDVEKFNNNANLIKELTSFLKLYESHIEIGFSEDNCLICVGEILRNTVREYKYLYREFKKQYKQIIEKYYGKVNLDEVMTLEFTRI